MEEEFNSKKSQSDTMQTLPTPWLDLLDPITELILEKLPLTDYLRFAAVCRKWRSIQKNHRLRFSPSQPPMSPSLPWLMPLRCKDSHLQCYSPLSQTFYRLRRISTCGNCIFSCHGWVFYINAELSYTFTLINPITTVKIHLPFLSLPEEFICDGSGAMSAPPTDPDCTILLLYNSSVFLYRVNDDLYRANNDRDRSWFHLHLPSPSLLPLFGGLGSTAVFSGGKFYCITESRGFYAIDPALPKPLVQVFDMDTSKNHWLQSLNFLVDFDGDVLLVVVIVDYLLLDDDILGFEVFRPGYSEKMWVRVDQLGDRALFVHHYCSFSLSSTVGCKKNCIYYPKSLLMKEIETDLVVAGDLFEVYNLESERWINEKPEEDAASEINLSQFKDVDGVWFLPRLDHVKS